MNKIINYVWLGPNNKPPVFYRCLESWKKYLPDYEIIEWNETTFDVLNHPYVSILYESESYSHASDYIRAWVLQQTSDFYFDIDLLTLKPIDFLLKFDAVYCFMADTLLTNAFSGAIKNHPTIIDTLKRILFNTYGTKYVKIQCSSIKLLL